MARDAAVSLRVMQEVKAALAKAAQDDGRTVAQYVERLIVASLKTSGHLKDGKPAS